MTGDAGQVTCRDCWKHIYCLLGQDRGDEPCRFFERERLQKATQAEVGR